LEGQEENSKKPIKKRSPLWYELPLAFSIIGGIIAYFAIRKDDPKKARNCLIISGFLLIFVVVLWIGMQVAFGIEDPFYVAASGSMIPELQVYDLIIITGYVPFDDIQIGDIIVFQRPSGHDRTIVHRVVSIVDDDPRTLRTKGDNNVASIPGTDYPITEKEYVGKVEHVVPQVGYITQFLKPPGNYLLNLAIMIIPVIMHFKFKKQQRKQEQEFT
jgi:signal peptidase